MITLTACVVVLPVTVMGKYYATEVTQNGLNQLLFFTV